MATAFVHICLLAAHASSVLNEGACLTLSRLLYLLTLSCRTHMCLHRLRKRYILFMACQDTVNAMIFVMHSISGSSSQCWAEHVCHKVHCACTALAASWHAARLQAACDVLGTTVGYASTSSHAMEEDSRAAYSSTYHDIRFCFNVYVAISHYWSNGHSWPHDPYNEWMNQ